MTKAQLEPAEAPEPPRFGGSGVCENQRVFIGENQRVFHAPTFGYVLENLRRAIGLDRRTYTQARSYIDSLGICCGEYFDTPRRIGSSFTASGVCRVVDSYLANPKSNPGEPQQWIPVAGTSKCLPTKDSEFHAKRARARKKLAMRNKSRKQNR